MARRQARRAHAQPRTQCPADRPGAQTVVPWLWASSHVLPSACTPDREHAQRRTRRLPRAQPLDRASHAQEEQVVLQHHAARGVRGAAGGACAPERCVLRNNTRWSMLPVTWALQLEGGGGAARCDDGCRPVQGSAAALKKGGSGRQRRLRWSLQRVGRWFSGHNGSPADLGAPRHRRPPGSQHALTLIPFDRIFFPQPRCLPRRASCSRFSPRRVTLAWRAVPEGLCRPARRRPAVADRFSRLGCRRCAAATPSAHRTAILPALSGVVVGREQ